MKYLSPMPQYPGYFELPDVLTLPAYRSHIVPAMHAAEKRGKTGPPLTLLVQDVDSDGQPLVDKDDQPVRIRISADDFELALTLGALRIDGVSDDEPPMQVAGWVIAVFWRWLGEQTDMGKSRRSPGA
jgi:hypothetical protein